MTDTKRSAARARGQALRTARVARARTIRRRIVAGSLALFLATWLLITIVLVSGHDPALASKSSATTSSSGTTVASTPAVSTTSTTTTPASGSSSSNSSSGGSASSVTTSQS